MNAPDSHTNERARQAALDQLRILDTPPEERFDRLTRIAARMLDVPIALISLIDHDRQWFKSCVGLDVSETPRSISFCGHAIYSGEQLIIEDAREDERFRDNPLVTGEPYIRFYAGTPIHSTDGHALGTLCVIDRKPRRLSAADQQCLRDLADCVEEQMSARKLAVHLYEQELKAQSESLAMMTQLADMVPGLLYQFRRLPDGTMSFPFSSGGIERTFGITPEEAKYNAAGLFDRVIPEDLPRVMAAIDESARQLSPWKIQFRIRGQNRDLRWIEGHSIPRKMPDGSIVWQGYIEDIDDKKQALLGLQESERQLRRLFELAPSGIVLCDYRQGSIIDVNAAMLKFTGYGKDEFLQLNYRELLPRDQTSQRSAVINQLRETGQFGPFEQEVVDHRGNTFPTVINVLLIQGPAEQKLLWVLVKNVSELKKVERMKNQFVSTVSHELRTPLTSITGAIRLLAGGAAGALPPKARQLVNIAERNADQLATLINDLLDTEKLMAGRLHTSPREQYLKPLLEQAASMNQLYGTQRNISVELAPGTPSMQVFVDAQRLLQALNNLISNAIKFSPDGDVVTLSGELHSRGGNPVAVIAVQDNGQGVPEPFQDQIFQRFAQADSSDTRSRGGTGLGLAITRELVSAMSGEVGFDSPPGRGATFWIRLPLVEGSQD